MPWEQLFLWALLVVPAAFWVWLLWGIRSAGDRKIIAIVAIQLSVFAFLFNAIRWSMDIALLGILYPYFALFIAAFDVFGVVNQTIKPWVTLPILIAIAATALICFRWPPTRIWVSLVFAFCFLALFLPMAEINSRRNMCQTAQALGVSEFSRHSYLWSMRNGSSEVQSGIHGHFILDNQHFGWSYSETDWYEIQEDIAKYVSSGPQFSCA